MNLWDRIKTASWPTPDRIERTVRRYEASNPPEPSPEPPNSVTGTTITCALCGGHEFVLGISLAGTTLLRCVDHDAHVEQMNLPAQRAARNARNDD